MAQINRYTQQQQPLLYNPRSLQELMMAASYMREQHDALDLGRMELDSKLAQVSGLDIHNERLKEHQDLLNQQSEAIAEQLQKEGFNSSSKSAFMKFNKDYQNAIGPNGEIGKIQTAKQVLEARKADYIANATKLGFPADAIAQNWEDEEAKYAEEFARTGKITNIKERFSPNYRNVTDELTKLLDNAGLTATDKANLTSNIITTDPRGQYVLTSSAQKAYSSNINQLQAAVDYINNQVMNPDSEIGQSLKEQRKTPEQALQETMGLSDVFLKTSEKTSNSSQISGFKSAAELGISNINGPLSYESMPAESIVNKQANYISKIDKILSGDEIATNEFGKDNPRRASGFQKGSNYQVATFENSFTSDEDIAEYVTLYNRLRQVQPELNNVQYNSPEAMQAVKSYLDNNQNILRQDLIITDDFVTTYGDRSSGLNKTDASKIAGEIKANPDLRKYSIDGKVYTYDKLPSGIRERFDDTKYSGYYSPKNFNTDKYGDFANKNLFISPLVLTDRDENGKTTRILVSRKTSDMETPAYKADAYFNDIFVNTNKFPGLPYKMPGQNTEIMYYPNGAPLPNATSDQKYMINTQDENGNYSNPILLTEEDLQNKINEGFGVMTPGEIKANNKKANK